MKHASVVFGVFVALMIATAVYHLVAMVAPLDASPPLRHLLFASINAALSVGLWYRPRWLVWPLAALVAQQLWSHGHDLVAACREQHTIDWMSVGVLLAMPTLLLLLLVDRRARASNSETASV